MKSRIYFLSVCNDRFVFADEKTILSDDIRNAVMMFFTISDNIWHVEHPGNCNCIITDVSDPRVILLDRTNFIHRIHLRTAGGIPWFLRFSLKSERV